MLEALTRNWWVLLIRGLAAIAFGVTAFAWPGITLLVLVILFAAHALVDGVLALALALSGRAQGDAWWAMMFNGVFGVLAGIGAFAWPGITEIVLLSVVAGWAIAHGVLEIVAAIRLRKVIENEWLLGLAGLISVLFGVALLARPVAGLLVIVWLIGANAIAFGLLAVALSLRLRKMRSANHHRTAPVGAKPV